MAQSISAMQQVWYSNTNTYNSIVMSVSTLGYGANSNSSFLIFNLDGNTRFRLDTSGSILPGTSNTSDLGSATFRWRNIYTGDLHLANEFGNWTIVEGEDELFLYNNKKDKVYKFNLTEVDKSDAPPKKDV
jgi:hypothetical protein